MTVRITDDEGTTAALSKIIEVVAYQDWDVNQDNRTNILDLILIGQHWSETGPPCWISEDINCDGIINILDMILVGQHWTG